MAAAGSVGSAALSATGNIMQGQSTANALNAQANLQIQNAKEAEEQGQFDATKQQVTAAHKIGTITANYGASGVTSSSGSVMDVLGASNMNAELDRQNILHGADVKAINYENQASLDKLGAQNAIQGSYWSALGSIGMGGASAWSKMYSGATPQSGGGSGSADDMGGIGGSDQGSTASAGGDELSGIGEDVA